MRIRVLAAALLSVSALVRPALAQQQQPHQQGVVPLSANWEETNTIEPVGYQPATIDTGAVETDTCDNCLSSSRLFMAMIEMPILQPNIGTLTAAGIGGASLTPDFNLGASTRITLGVQNQDGLGVRARYWYFDHSAQPTATTLAGADVKAQTLDLETFQNTSLKFWQLGWFGGMRYANSDIGLSIPAIGGLHAKFEGLGPTVGVSALRPLGNSKFSMFGNVRGSWIYGDTRLGGTDALAVINPLGLRANDHVTQIFETQLGIQYGHGPMFARVAVESQTWQYDVGFISFNMGYIGPTVALGLVY